MEPTLGKGLGDLFTLIVWPYLVIFILLSSLVKGLFGNFLQRITKFDWKSVYTVLILATIIGVPYALLTTATWVEVLLTYTIGTSFHELLFKYIEKKVGKLFNGD